MALSTQDVTDAVRRFALVIEDSKDDLIALDSAIGDADHGENMARGMRAVMTRLSEEELSTPADVLRAVATTLISTVGGAAGPLYGTAFLRGSVAVKDQTELDASAVVDLLGAARDGIVARGKAEPGDKTMVDAWTPAVDAARAAAKAGGDVTAVLAAAADAADQGVRDTVPLVARKGRASYLGERSVGHQDPGATSSAMLLRAFAASP